MKSIILVGGYGSRLKPLTLDTPKQMLEVVGLTMLERVLDQLHRFGVDEAILSLGYLPEVFTEAYPKSSARGVRLSYAVEESPLDTGGAIKWAAQHMKSDETFVAVNGDVLTDLNLQALLKCHRQSKALATISLVPVDDPSTYGVVSTDLNGKVIDFIEKPSKEDAPTNLINAGAYMLEPSALETIELGQAASIEREIFPYLTRKSQLYALASPEYWIDAGTPQTLLRACLDILQGRRGAIEIPGTLSHDGCYISPDVAEIAGSVVGRSYIGGHVSIASGSVVRASVIEDGAIVEEGATVLNSLVLTGARISAGSVVDRSIIGPGSHVPAQSMVIAGSVISRHAELLEGCRIEGERVPS